MRKYLKFVPLFILISGLLLINRSIFRFEYHDVHERVFSPENDPKGFYPLGDFITLKPGKYQLSVSGDIPNEQAEIIIIDDQDAILFQYELETVDQEAVYDFEIKAQTHKIRICFNYEPKSGYATIDHIMISSPHVVTKESVITHGVRSLLLLVICILLFLRIERPGVFYRLFPFLSNPENETDLILLIVLTIFVSVPSLLPNQYIDGIDTKFHLNRLQGIAANLKAGLFPPRIELNWMDNVGYGVGFFYPEILMTIPAFFLLLGFSLIQVYKATGILIVFFTLLSHYKSAKILSSGNRIAGLSAAVFISLAAYRLQTHFIRDGLGESFATIFLPLIAAGLCQIFHRESKGWITLAAGFTGTLLSHILSFILAVIITAFFLLFNIRKIIKCKEIFYDLCKAAIFTILLTAFFVFPMLEQKFSVPELKINQITEGKINIAYATTTQPAAGLLIFSQPPFSNPVIFYPGWSLLLIPLLCIILNFLKYDNLHTAKIMAFISVIILIISTDLFPWHKFQFFLNDIQFSFRLIQSATVLLCLAGSLCISRICQSRTGHLYMIAQFLLCLITAIPVYYNITQVQLKNSIGFSIQNDTIYGGEYMPPQLSRAYIRSHIDIIKDTAQKAQFSNIQRSGLSLRFNYETDDISDNICFTVPFIYYKGYAAEIQSSGSDITEVIAEPADNGFVRIRGTYHPDGKVRVWYKGTTIQTISEIITLMTIIGCLIKKSTIICQTKKHC